jgi:hypothetical protein
VKREIRKRTKKEWIRKKKKRKNRVSVGKGKLGLRLLSLNRKGHGCIVAGKVFLSIMYREFAISPFT